jgi:DNA replication protein DnaC
VSNNCATGEQQLSTNKNVEKEENVKNEKNQSAFDRFWDAYPKKKSKGRALKAWNSLKLNSKIEIILKAIGWQKTTSDWTKDGGQFIPHPASWLNARAWEDEPMTTPERKVAFNNPRSVSAAELRGTRT